MFRKGGSGGAGSGGDSGSSRLKAATAGSTVAKRSKVTSRSQNAKYAGAAGNKWSSSSRELDRKSSRGMIYENEELRLRTININAEVERGQSDIRKLRRENEQLKREIWSLRDEYDRINKKMCAQKNCSSCEHINNNSDSQSEDSDESCGSCQQDDDEDEFLEKSSLATEDHQSINKGATGSISHAGSIAGHLAELNYETANQEIAENFENSQKNSARGSTTTTLLNRHNCKAPPSIESVSNKLRENLHVNFGHLSILSEENLTASSDGASEDRGEGTAAAATVAGRIRLETSMEGNYTNYPINPVDVLHSPLHDVQSILPPLSHFENIPYDTSTNSSSLDNQSNSATSTTTTTTGETVIAATTLKEWDFSTPTTTTASTMITSTPAATESNTSLTPSSVSDTTMTTTTTTQTRSPKHFFSPIKPRIQQLPAPYPAQLHSSMIQQTPLPPPPPPPAALFFAANPPDLFVANALASPYHRSVAATGSSATATTTTDASRLCRSSPPPLIPLRSKTTTTAVRQPSPPPSFYDSNFDDLLLEIETLQAQLEKHKSLSHEKLPTAGAFFSDYHGGGVDFPTSGIANVNLATSNSPQSPTPLSKRNNTTKPYRSEMNLVVSCNGNKPPIITPITKTSSASMTTGFQFNANYFSQYSGSSKFSTMASDTPPPSIPQPMILFPQNLTYLTGTGAAAAAAAVGNTGPASGTVTDFDYDPTPLTAAMQTATSVPILTDYGIGDYATVRIQPGLRTALTYDPTLSSAMTAINLLPQSLNTSAVDIALPSASSLPPLTGTTIISQLNATTTVPPETLTAKTNAATSSPNRKTSEMVAPRSPASVRRKIFSNQRDDEIATGGSITSEKDTTATTTMEKIVKRTASNASEHGHNDSSSGSDTTKRKASRRVSIIFGDRKKSSSTSERLNEAERDRETEANTQTNKAIASTIGTTLANEMLQKGRSKSPNAGEFVTQSTPNSPHSTSSRRTSIVATANSPHHQLHNSSNASSGSGTGHHHHHHHHHHGGRKFSQETIGGGGATKSSSSSLTAHKCSRRFSEGTVDAFDNGGHIDATPITGGDSSGGSRRLLDSFHEPGTSISERNSNSFASSRESSTSQSIHSQRRKISVSSHNGGKIPWCGCWGNGCL